MKLPVARIQKKVFSTGMLGRNLINAANAIGLKKPIVIRLKGTNVEEAVRLIEASGIKMIVTNDLDDAAAKAVNVVNIIEAAEKVNLEVSFNAA